MANCDFYAVGDDFVPILDFVFAQPGWVLVELASRHNEPLRRFRSTAEVASAFDLGRDAAYFQLHAPEAGGAISERPVTFKPGAVPGATGRTDSAGWGLIQLYLIPGTPERVGLSHTNCNSEKRAREWQSTAKELGPIDEWNWREVDRASQRLNRYIRRLGVRKERSRVILPAAAQRVAQGATLEP